MQLTRLGQLHKSFMGNGFNTHRSLASPLCSGPNPDRERAGLSGIGTSGVGKDDSEIWDFYLMFAFGERAVAETLYWSLRCRWADIIGNLWWLNAISVIGDRWSGLDIPISAVPLLIFSISDFFALARNNLRRRERVDKWIYKNVINSRAYKVAFTAATTSTLRRMASHILADVQYC
ncbi:hypothetical protein GWI33_015687 [Rhynchophorus ferrugineus]|uniref:Uncharacterized protein n=1 Tax=Rhynchophorus ferrugineus TaxID=354439 RepID=A0A834HZD3_RHYFE|nr:hypothetical protein GWI33_015687 [Rhynchophorus ferrugineus]